MPVKFGEIPPYDLGDGDRQKGGQMYGQQWDARHQKLIKAHIEPMAQVSELKCTNAMCP